MELQHLKNTGGIAVLSLMALAGCKIESGDWPAKNLKTTPAGATSDVLAGSYAKPNEGVAASNGAPFANGANSSNPSALADKDSSTSSASKGTPTPVPSQQYTAKVTKVNASKDNPQKYNMEVTFTSAQGRHFLINVLNDKSGAVVFSERVESVPDYYYAHTASFSYARPLPELKVLVMSADGRETLDTWDL